MKKYLESNDISRVSDKLIDITDSQIDTYCSEEGSTLVETLENIKRVAIERVAYRKLRNALLNEMIGE